MVRSIKKKKQSQKKSKAQKKEDGSSTKSMVPAKVWRPGVDAMEEDEELQCDPSAYDCLHALTVDWPSLSFDILQDDLGLTRKEFPHTLYCVSGTQADQASKNFIRIMRLSNVSGRKRKLVPEQLEDSENDSDSDEDEDDNENGLSKIPTLQLRLVAHQGSVNRIRSMCQQPHICATWADNGFVQVWDFSAHLNSLVASDPRVQTGAAEIARQAPLQIFNGHKDEGYAMDWSRLTPGKLVTGDCKRCIHLWTPTTGGKWVVDRNPFTGHRDSVEDLQWSPTEDHVFASCSVDGRIAIWDCRENNRAAAAYINAHSTDVNVISWNRLASCMLASGSDDGSFSIWDLRGIQRQDFSPVAHFQYHKKPITSIEWSPHDMSVLAVSSSDNQLTIWDFSLERDAEEEDEFKLKVKDQVNAPEDLPPQLLFVHQGQKDLKELHWHSQVPGMIMSTAADGFNVFIPSNLEKTLAD
ncbi:unnamed protein product [Victoria cruziana]